jgi:hypothetical protein
MKYLAIGSKGPGSATPKEMIEVLEHGILPTFECLMKLEKEKKISGGLAVGDRRLIFILEAKSNEEADDLLRSLPAWAVLEWQITPMLSFAARAAEDRKALKQLKQAK